MNPKRLLKGFVFYILYFGGVHHLFRWWNRNKLLAVMYHGVCHTNGQTPESWLQTPADAFEQQLRYLKRHYQVLHVSEAISRWDKRLSFNRPTCCLTFDDGYENNYSVAWPLLEKYRCPATIYLVTGLIGTDQVHWTVKLERAFQKTAATQLDLSEHDLPVYDLATDRRALVDLTARIYRCHGMDRQKVLASTFSQLGLADDEDFSDFLSMSWIEAAEMQESKIVEFGGHTVTHSVVSALDDDGQKQEIAGSMAEVGEHLGWPVYSFAYPNGTSDDFDERAKENVRATGAIAAFSTIRGLNDPRTDRYALRRIHVSNQTTLIEFKLRTSGVLSVLRWLIRGSD